MKFKKLFQRKSELPTALQIKSQKWTDSNYVGFLENVASSKPATYTFVDGTLAALCSPVERLSCRIHRYAAINLLMKLGLNRPPSKLYMDSMDVEKAISTGYLEDIDDDKAATLLQIAPIELFNLVLSGFQPNLPTLNALLEWLVDQRLYTDAKRLWGYHHEKISDYTLERLFVLAGDHQDLDFQAELTRHYASPDLASAALNSMDPDSIAIALTSEVPITLQSSSTAARTLADQLQHSLELAAQRPSQQFMNLILYGVFLQYTSRLTFSIYRHLLTLGLTPTSQTVEILCNAALRLGNSKTLAYEIWRDHAHLANRKIVETLLRCQLVRGQGSRTSLYFLWEMKNHKIYLRHHIHTLLLEWFGDDSEYTKIAGNLVALDKYSHWNPDLAKEEAKTFAPQQERNRLAYTEPTPVSELDELLAFEERRRTQTST